MKKAAFLSLTKSDWIKGAITAFCTSFLTGISALLTNLINSLQGGTAVNLPSVKIQLLVIVGTGIVSMIGYIIKNLFTNSNDQFAKAEPKMAIVNNSTTGDEQL